MATSTQPNPILKAVSTSDTNPHQLLALLKAAFPTVVFPNKCAQIEIYLDENAAGELYIGNDDVSTSNYARRLIQTGYWDSFARPTNDFPLQDVWILAGNSGATKIGVTILSN